jgi:hypothetical protein
MRIDLGLDDLCIIVEAMKLYSGDVNELTDRMEEAVLVCAAEEEAADGSSGSDGG